MNTSWITDRWCFCGTDKVASIIRGNRNMLIHMKSSDVECYKKAFLEKNIEFKDNVEDFNDDIACWTYDKYYEECQIQYDMEFDNKYLKNTIPPKNCFVGYKFSINKPALKILNP